MSIRTITPREKHARIELLPEGTDIAGLITAGGLTDSLEIGPYPAGSIHVILTTPAAVAYRIQQSNVDAGAAYQDITGSTADIGTSKLLPVTDGATYLRVKFTAGTGKVRVVYNAALQS